MAKVDWDQKEYEEGRAGFEALPKGRYSGRVTGVEKKDTKRKDGYFFECEFTLDSENAKNRKVWAMLNVSNPSEVAQRIGREQWNALCVACGFEIGEVSDTRNLIGKRVVVLVDTEKKQDDSIGNRVTGFFPSDGSAPATTTGRMIASVPNRSNTPKADTAKAGTADDDDIPF